MIGMILEIAPLEVSSFSSRLFTSPTLCGVLRLSVRPFAAHTEWFNMGVLMGSGPETVLNSF